MLVCKLPVSIEPISLFLASRSLFFGNINAELRLSIEALRSLWYLFSTLRVKSTTLVVMHKKFSLGFMTRTDVDVSSILLIHGEGRTPESSFVIFLIFK